MTWPGGGSRPARAPEICAVLKGLGAVNWVRKISTLSSNSEGKGVLEIEIANDIHVKTWNNALSDISDQTLIDPGSTLFAKISALKVGQKVVFSGTDRYPHFSFVG